MTVSVPPKDPEPGELMVRLLDELNRALAPLMPLLPQIDQVLNSHQEQQ